MSWVEALDELEALLVEQTHKLEEGDLEDFRFFEAPADLGPLPVELVPRAQALHDASVALAGVALEAQAAVGRQLAVAHRLAADSGPATGERPSTFVDSRD